MKARYGKFLDMILAVRINVSLVDILAGMPNYGKYLKGLVSNSHKLEQISSAFLSNESSAMIEKKVPPKLKDPESFLIPCTFSKTLSCNALADLGASINLMPYSLYAKLFLETLKPTKISDSGLMRLPAWRLIRVSGWWEGIGLGRGLSGSGNDTDSDDADIRPIYDEEPMVEVQLTAECNIFAIGQQHTEQPQIIVEGQHGQILNETSNKAKIEKEIDVLETMNIELEHSVAKLHKENETLKQHYKDLYDSIKITRSKTTEQTTSLLANNAELKAQIQEKVFAIAALKNDLRKLKGNSVDTKFDKTSVLGKPVLPSLRNQSVVRQPNAFKSERAQMSKQRFASQVDVNKNLSKPVTQHYLPKKTESAFAKPDHPQTQICI
ncbi:actin-binding, cofilin/tropomyosin type protein [Tanacetum coccineum]